MVKRKFQYIWGFSLLVVASLACNLLSGIGGKVGEVRETAQSVATNVQGGRNLIATAQELATQAEGSGLVQTAQAVVTEQGPGLLATIQAFSTEQAPGLLETAQAYITEEGPGLVETGQAIATQIAAPTVEVPDDIPIVSGEKQNFYSTESLISYSTTLDFKSVLNFYETQMPANEWTKVEQDSVVSGNTALLSYTKAGRKVSIVINGEATSQTSVIITQQNK